MLFSLNYINNTQGSRAAFFDTIKHYISTVIIRWSISCHVETRYYNAIFKGQRNRLNPASYRPISICSCQGKLLERVMQMQFMH